MTTRAVALDHRLLATHRAGRVLAFDARAVGSSLTLHSERPGPAALVSPSGAAGSSTAVSVAVVDIIGPLAQRGEQHVCGFVDGYDWIGERLGAALEAADSVVLRIDSPGGDVAGLDEAVQRMRAMVARTGKRVVAYVDELAASAAYWLAAGVADEIVVPAMGGVGSIGSFGVLADVTEANAQDGVKLTIVRDPPGKAESHPDAPIADLAESRMRELVSAATGRFIDAVAVRRGLSTTVLRALNGAVLRGADAVAAGLADRVGTIEDVFASAAFAGRDKDQTMKTRATGAIVAAAAVPAVKAADPKPEDKPAEPAPAEEAPKEAAAVPVEDGKVTCPGCGMEFPVEMPGAPAPAPEEASALVAALIQVTGSTNAAGALATLVAWKAERADGDRRVRADLVAQLVAAGGALPVDAWRDPIAATDPSRREVSPIFAALPLEDLRARVVQRAAVPAAMRRSEPVAPTTHGLTEREQAYCARANVDPQKYAATKAASERRSGRAET